MSGPTSGAAADQMPLPSSSSRGHKFPDGCGRTSDRRRNVTFSCDRVTRSISRMKLDAGGRSGDATSTADVVQRFSLLSTAAAAARPEISHGDGRGHGSTVKRRCPSPPAETRRDKKSPPSHSDPKRHCASSGLAVILGRKYPNSRMSLMSIYVRRILTETRTEGFRFDTPSPDELASSSCRRL